jgi:L-iditol 2-dehydrogenase
VGIDVGAEAPAKLGLIQSKALRLRGLIGSVGLWPRTIRFLASSGVDATSIVTATFPLEEALDAFAAARDTAENIKVHLATSA